MNGSRETSINVVDHSPMSGSHSHGGSSAQDGSQSAGFTAVNGDVRRTTATQPDVARSPGAAPTTGTSNADHLNTSLQESLQDSRSTENETQPETQRENQHHDVSTGSKRKRAGSHDRSPLRDIHLDTRTTDTSGLDSPKRRQILSIADSAIDLTSPNNDATNGIQMDLPSERNSAAPQEREPSPVPRRNQMEPPPRPRPETEASLAESVLKFQQNREASENRQSQSGSAERDASPEEDDDEQDGQGQGDGQTQGDSLDPKKRKRNFSNRTKTGCHTCRTRKKKCDEKKPTCGNCEKGGFQCLGYGPKQPGHKAPVPARLVQPLQSKGHPYETTPGPAGYYQHHPPPSSLPPPPHHPPDDVRQYNQWHYPPPDHEQARRHWDAQPPPPPLPRPGSQGGRDWGRPPWSYGQTPPLNQHRPLYAPDRQSPASLPPLPPAPPYPLERQSSFPIPAPSFDQWSSGQAHYRHPSGAPTIGSSRDSIASAGSHRWSLTSPANEKPTNKQKMLTGQPYEHYQDHDLWKERHACQAALVLYNNAADPSVLSLPVDDPRRQDWTTKKAKILMEKVLCPPLLQGGLRAPGPTGSIKGSTTHVQAPFNCEFGYHLHIGEDTVIESGCDFRDAGGIYIGDNVLIGPHVQILTMTFDKDANAPRGNKGLYRAGMVEIEDNVFIGAGATIMPYVKIGKNAVVGAGSVVTSNVKADSFVAGNPAKVVEPRVSSSERRKKEKEEIIKSMEKKAKKNWEPDSESQGQPESRSGITALDPSPLGDMGWGGLPLPPVPSRRDKQHRT